MKDIAIGYSNSTDDKRFIRPGGAIVAGLDLLVQKFALYFSSTMNSDPLYSRQYGTDFVIYNTYNKFVTEYAFITWFKNTATNFIAWLESTYEPDTPLEEQIGVIDLVSFNFDKDSVKLNVSITNKAGSEVTTVIFI